MLTEIRDRATGWIAWIIVIIISIPFALWGVNEYFSVGESLTVAVVNGEEISQQQYQYALEERRSMARRLMGSQFDADAINSPEFRQAVLDNLILRQLLDENAEKAGYRVGDEELANYITTVPQFQTDGQFDPALYRRQVMSQGFNEAGYEAVLRREFVLQQIRDGLSRSSIVTRQDEENILSLAQEVRVFDYVTMDPESFVPDVEVTDDEIAAHYEENENLYESPEMTRIQYVELSIDELVQEVEISDEEVARYFEDNPDLYKSPDQRKASHILITVSEDAEPDVVADAKTRAQELTDRARAGEDFAELARANSEDPGSSSAGGDLGIIEPGLMVKPFEDALFSMQQGDVSDPIKTRYGFHVIKLTELISEPGKELSEVSEEIRAQEKRRIAENMFADRAENFRNIVFEQPESLEPVAEELELEIQESNWFSRTEGEGIAAEPMVREIAFSDDVFIDQLNSEAVELNIDTLVALRNLESRGESLKPLDEVREEIRATLVQEKARATAAEAGQEVLAAIDAGGDWDSVLLEKGLTAEQVSQSRVTSGANAPLALVNEIFRSQPPGDGPEFGGVPLADGSFVVYRLTETMPGDPADADPAFAEQIDQTLAQRRGADYFLSYQNGLRDSAKIEIFQENLQPNSYGN